MATTMIMTKMGVRRAGMRAGGVLVQELVIVVGANLDTGSLFAMRALPKTRPDCVLSSTVMS